MEPTASVQQQWDAVQNFLNDQDFHCYLLTGRQQTCKQLLNDLILHQQNERCVVRIQASSSLDPTHLIQTLSYHWQVIEECPSSSRAKPQVRAGLERLKEYMSQHHQQRYLLIVDDIELAPLSVLSAVASLVGDQPNSSFKVLLSTSQHDSSSMINAMMEHCVRDIPSTATVNTASVLCAQDPEPPVATSRKPKWMTGFSLSILAAIFGATWVTHFLLTQHHVLPFIH